MKKIILLFIFFIALTVQNLFTQPSLNPDSLRQGFSYKFVLYDESEVIGKIYSQDSFYINVKGDDGYYRIRKDDIFFISRELIGSKYKVKLSLGGGLCFFGNEFEDHYNSDLKSQVSLQLSLLMPLSENKGVRIDAGYSRWKRDGAVENSYYGYYSSYSDRFSDLYYLKGDFIFGQISPVEKFSLYGLAGAGIHIWSESEYTYTYKYDSVHYNTHFYKDGNNVNAIFSIGGGFGYRFTKRLGAYAEVQLNTITYGGYFLFIWGRTYFPIRAGVTYIIY